MTTEQRSDEPRDVEDRLRERAVRRLKDQADFRGHLLVYVLVNALLVLIWAMTTAGFFWPIFLTVAWGIGVAAHAWDAFGPDRPSEIRIRREMDRMRGRE